jgi:replication factor A1
LNGGVKVKINELKDGMKRVSVEAKVTEKSETREVLSRFKDQTHKVANAIVADETGTIKLTLWNDQINMVNINDTIRIDNGYVTSFRGEIQLNVGKYGTLTVQQI